MLNEKLNASSLAVQKHLDIYQNIIQRMASNSSSCKLWCVTLVSATFVLVAGTGTGKGSLPYLFIMVIPVLAFAILDAYYLTLEQKFRDSYSNFVKKIHKAELELTDIYVVVPDAIFKKKLFKWKSFSIIIFYPCLLLLVIILSVVLLTLAPLLSP